MGVCLFVTLTEHFNFSLGINKQMLEPQWWWGKPVVIIRETTEICRATLVIHSMVYFILTLFLHQVQMPTCQCIGTVHFPQIENIFVEIHKSCFPLHLDPAWYLIFLFWCDFHFPPLNHLTCVVHYITSCQRTFTLSKHISRLREEGWES